MAPAKKSSSHPEKKDSSLRMKHKMEKKLQFHTKVKNTFASLTATKTIAKKKLRSRQRKIKAYDLSSLAEFLPDVSEFEKKMPDVANKSKLNCKSKQKLVEKEANQLASFLVHKEFVSDPVSVIHQHLLETLCPPPSDQKSKPEKRSKKNGSQKRHKSRAKAVNGNMKNLL